MKNNVTMWGHLSNTQGHGIPLNLQHFADPNPGADPEPPAEPKTYTEDEVKALLQSEADKRVTEALKKREEKYQADLKDALEAQKDEALRLAQLTADERDKEKFEKAKAQLDKDRKAFERERLELEVQKELTKEDLDPAFAAVVMGDTAEQSLANIKALKDSFTAAVESRVKERLGGNPPQIGNRNTGSNPFSKEEFNLTQQGNLYRKDPDKYRQLKNLN